MKKDLTMGNPIKVILLFSIPLFFSVIFQQLYCIADSFIAGKYIGKDALSAIGNAYDITHFYMAFAFGCNTGCQVICAKYFGSKNYGNLKSTVTTTFIFTIIFVSILTLFGLLLAKPILQLVQTPSDLLNDSLIYLNIYTTGLAFLFFYNISVGVFSAIGDSKTPFIFLLFSSVSNVILDIVFVKYLNWGMAGIAWATFICQAAACVLSIIVLVIRLKPIVHGCEAKVWDKDIFKSILIVGIPSTLQQLSVSIGNIIIRGRINSFGTDVMAGYAAAIKLNNLFVISIAAIGTAISNFASQNFSVNQIKRIKKGYFGSFILVGVIVTIFTLSYVIFAKDLIRLFMSDSDQTKDAIATGAAFLYIVSPGFILVSIKIVSDGVLRGTLKMNLFMISTFTDLVIRVILAYVFSSFLGSSGIWISWPIGWFIGMTVAVYFVIHRFKKLQAKDVESPLIEATKKAD